MPPTKVSGSEPCPELIQRLTFVCRYEIEGDAPGWEEAEKQVKNAAKRGKDGIVVSVKSGKTKRKTGPTAEQIYEEELGDKKRKKVKLGKKAKMS